MDSIQELIKNSRFSEALNILEEVINKDPLNISAIGDAGFAMPRQISWIRLWKNLNLHQHILLRMPGYGKTMDMFFFSSENLLLR